MAVKVRKVRGLPPFEVSNKPWFGPTARAAEMLERATDHLEPEEALRRLGEILRDDIDRVQHVRFIDFFHNKKKRRFHLAICWTFDDPMVRDRLYYEGGHITESIGWYPLPQGFRLGSLRSASLPSQPPLTQLPGRPTSLSSAVPSDGGCSLRLGFSGGDSLLLDAGLPGKLEPVPTDRAVFISHAHLDHTGGLVTGAVDPTSLSVLMASTVPEMLADEKSAAHRPEIHRITGGQVVSLGDAELEAFSVPHQPGALGCVVRADTGSVVYTGDCSLRSARHDFIPVLQDIAYRQPGPVHVLLDATMAGRTGGAGTIDIARVLAGRDDVSDLVVVGDDPTHLLYAYLDLWHTIQRGDQRHSRSFIVTSDLLPTFRLVHQAFITRSIDALDPFLSGQYGTAMPAWGESRWLFWMRHTHRYPEGPRIWFVTPRELDGIPGTGSVVRVGRERDPIQLRPGWELLNYDTSGWTLHSDDSVLASAVAALTAVDAGVILFHNFPKRLRNWVRERGLCADVVSGTPLPLVGTTG